MNVFFSIKLIFDKFLNYLILLVLFIAYKRILVILILMILCQRTVILLLLLKFFGHPSFMNAPNHALNGLMIFSDSFFSGLKFPENMLHVVVFKNYKSLIFLSKFALWIDQKPKSRFITKKLCCITIANPSL